jgi:hypothetical protein
VLQARRAGDTEDFADAASGATLERGMSREGRFCAIGGVDPDIVIAAVVEEAAVRGGD